MSEEMLAAAALTRHQAKYGRWAKLVPEWETRPADRHNARRWWLNWLCFSAWDSHVAHLGFWFEIAPELRFQVHLPYLHLGVRLPLIPHHIFYGKLCRQGNPSAGESNG